MPEDDKNDWETLGKLLDSFYTPEEAAQFLSADHPQLMDGVCTPIEKIENGDIKSVILILKRMDDGVYL